MSELYGTGSSAPRPEGAPPPPQRAPYAPPPLPPAAYPVPPQNPYSAGPPAYGVSTQAYAAGPPAYGTDPQAHGTVPGAVYGPPPTYSPSYYAPAPPRPTSGLAIASIVCGGIGLLLGPSVPFLWFPLLISIAAIVLGHVALGQLRRSPAVGGRGLALTGVIMGYVPVALSVLLVVLFLFGALAFGSIALPFLSR